jgi:hypothetical protein
MNVTKFCRLEPESRRCISTVDLFDNFGGQTKLLKTGRVVEQICHEDAMKQHYAYAVRMALLSLMFLPFLAGCGAEAAKHAASTYEIRSYAEDGSTAESIAYRTESEKNAGMDDGVPPAGEPDENTVPVEARTRKLTRRAEFSLEAASSLRGENMNGAARKIEELALRYGGYIEQSSADVSSINSTIRVPSAFYDELLSGVSALGKIISRHESAEDVTLKYYDLAGRLDTKKSLLATYRSYLARASNIEEILGVESRIADLQHEIDWLGTQLAGLANLVDYATVSIYLYNPAEIRPYSLGDRIVRLFDSFGGVASGALIAILGIVIFGVPAVALILLAYWLLFGRIGLLKKAFRLASAPSGGKTVKSKSRRDSKSEKAGLVRESE